MAKSHHYGLDFCPAFREWLIAGKQAKRTETLSPRVDERLMKMGVEP